MEMVVDDVVGLAARAIVRGRAFSLEGKVMRREERHLGTCHEGLWRCVYIRLLIHTT